MGNINLAENSADEIDTAGIEAAPGIYASYKSNRADGILDYTFIGRAFEAEDYDSVSHLLNAHGSYMLARDLFFIDAQAGYSDSIIDAAQGTNYGGVGLFNRGNMEETGRASVTPRLTKQLGGFRFDARYTYGRVWYFESDDVANPDTIFIGFNEDSEDQDAYVSLGTADPDNAATFKAYYQWQESQYDLSRPYRYERAGADTSLRLTRTLRLVADGGVETDLTSEHLGGRARCRLLACRISMGAGQPHVFRRQVWPPVLRRQLQLRGAARDALADAEGIVLGGSRGRDTSRSESNSTRTTFRCLHRRILPSCRPRRTCERTRR